MRRPFRLALAAVGIAAAMYGAASLTGGRVETPPSSEAQDQALLGQLQREWDRQEASAVVSLHLVRESDGARVRIPRPGAAEVSSEDGTAHVREWTSGAVIAAGLGLAAFALWPRKATTVTAARDASAG